MVFKLTNIGFEASHINNLNILNINANSNNSTFSLQSHDSETIFDGSSSHLFYPHTNGTSSSFTNNSQILSHGSNGAWGSHTYITTTDTPDGSNSMILQSQSYGYAGLHYPNGNSFSTTISYWVKFDHDSDDTIMTSIQSNGWGGSLFTIGNSNEDGRQINIQFEPNTGFLRVFVNGVNSAINSVPYQSIKYTANNWLLLSLSIENTNVKCFINGILQFSFEIQQLLIDSYNQLYSTSFTSLSQTLWSGYLNNYTNIIMLLRDIQPTYYSFQLWKIYVFDRILTDNEHLTSYSNSNNSYSTTINSKRFSINITFSSDIPLPNYTQDPYVLTINNSSVNFSDQIVLNVQSDYSSIYTHAYYIQEGSFKLAIFNYNTDVPFTDTLSINVCILT